MRKAWRARESQREPYSAAADLSSTTCMCRLVWKNRQDVSGSCVQCRCRPPVMDLHPHVTISNERHRKLSQLAVISWKIWRQIGRPGMVKLAWVGPDMTRQQPAAGSDGSVDQTGRRDRAHGIISSLRPSRETRSTSESLVDTVGISRKWLCPSARRPKWNVVAFSTPMLESSI
jgi:hypothetical protein